MLVCLQHKSSKTCKESSLVKSICYPEALKFSTAPIRWGCRNEGRSLEAYQKSIGQFHQSLTISGSGLNVDPRWPYLGASPDGFVNCKCCGQGVCEINCPYAQKDAVISHDAISTQSSSAHVEERDQELWGTLEQDCL